MKRGEEVLYTSSIFRTAYYVKHNITQRAGGEGLPGSNLHSAMGSRPGVYSVYTTITLP